MQNNSSKTLLLFTLSFPYTIAGEHTFLQHEISFLLQKFRKVIIIPESIEGEKVGLDKDIKIDYSFNKFLKYNVSSSRFIKLIKGFSMRYFVIELLNKPDILFSFRKIIKLLNTIYRILLVKKWFHGRYLDNNKYLIYTYWFTSTTVALVENNAVVTRVHGKDLYEERNNDYIPLRKFALSKIRKVFCVSNAGVSYLSNKYPMFTKKYRLSRLGVQNRNTTIALKKQDSVFRIVSCSGLIPLKRVDLILESVIEFSKRHNAISIEYTHFGDGSEMKRILEIISTNQCENLKINFKGNVGNGIIIDYYSNNYIDIFINASTSEGIPVSIMEAQSFGIPFIATRVGGIPEMMHKNNGILISQNPDKQEIADAIEKIYNSGGNEVSSMRHNSYNNWNENFNSDQNFERFTDEIALL